MNTMEKVQYIWENKMWKRGAMDAVHHLDSMFTGMVLSVMLPMWLKATSLCPVWKAVFTASMFIAYPVAAFLFVCISVRIAYLAKRFARLLVKYWDVLDTEPSVNNINL